MALPLVVRAHAKVNLSLRVLGTRDDGYHELKTVFQSLALHDTLTVGGLDAGAPLALSCDVPGIPVDARNLVWRAASLVWADLGRPGEPAGVRVHIRKRIPAQGGLGGGSADAAAALVAFDRFWGGGLGTGRLAELGRRLGADVPFFLCGGTALGLSRGDEIYPLADVSRRHVVLVFPPFGVSTPDAYGWLDAERDREERDREGPAARAGPGSRLPLAGGVGLEVVNDLEAPVARRHPEIAEVRGRLCAVGAEVAAMSGSGSTVFGLFTGREAARQAALALRSRGWETCLTRTATRRQAGWPPLE